MLVNKIRDGHFPTPKERIDKWVHVYNKDGLRWGLVPSLTAHLALTDINDFTNHQGPLLDIGCGYCRDLLLFHTVFKDMNLEGLEPASQAIELAKPIMSKKFFKNLICNDIFDFGRLKVTAKYKVVFANYFIHLFSRHEQLWILGLISKILKKNGICILSWVSTHDHHYRNGRYLSNQTYEVYNGIPWRFTTCSMVEKMVYDAGMKVLKLNEFIEVEIIKGKLDRVDGIYLVCSR
jgi:SAM-dependent methyltransferase